MPGPAPPSRFTTPGCAGVSCKTHFHSRAEVRTMPTPKKSAIPADKLELYDRLIASNLEIDRKGATHPYTSFNGHMFTLLNPPGKLAIRLPEAEREKFIKKYKTTLFEAYGAVMAEFVAVPDALLPKTKELAKYLDLSYAYVKTLKPKPSKKKS
jgi:hypothetical protein